MSNKKDNHLQEKYLNLLHINDTTTTTQLTSFPLNSARENITNISKKPNFMQRIIEVKNKKQANPAFSQLEQIIVKRNKPGLSLANYSPDSDSLYNFRKSHNKPHSNRISAIFDDANISRFKRVESTKDMLMTTTNSNSRHHKRVFSIRGFIRNDNDNTSMEPKEYDSEVGNSMSTLSKKTKATTESMPITSNNTIGSLSILKPLNLEEKEKQQQSTNKKFINTNIIGEIYSETKTLSIELMNILEKRYDHSISMFCDSFNTQGLCNIQKSRLKNYLKIFEKKFLNEKLPKTLRTMTPSSNMGNQGTCSTNNLSQLDILGNTYVTNENNVSHDIIELLINELKAISYVYEKYIYVLDEALKKSTAKGKHKLNMFDMDLFDGLDILMGYSKILINHNNNNIKNSQCNSKDNDNNKDGTNMDDNEEEDVIAKELNMMESLLYKFKINYKTKKELNVRGFECFEKLENVIKNLCDMINQNTKKYMDIKYENDRLLDLNQELNNKYMTKNEDYLTLFHQYNLLLSNKENTEMTALTKNYYTKKIEELQLENDQIKSEIEKLNIKVNTQHDELIKYNQKYNNIANRKIMVDKSTDMNVKFDHEVFKHNKFKLSDIFYSLTSISSSSSSQLMSLSSSLSLDLNGAIQDEEWILNILNMIYSDKIITDMLDDNEKIPRQSLIDYICEWFLKRYGIYQISYSLLNDFIRSIIYYHNKNERYKIFCDLCGIQYIVDNDNQNDKQSDKVNKVQQYNKQNIEKSANKQKLRKEYYQSIDCLNIYLKLIYYLKTHTIMNVSHPTYGQILQLNPLPFFSQLPGSGYNNTFDNNQNNQNNMPPISYNKYQILPFIGCNEELISVDLCKMVMSALFTEEKINSKDYHISFKDLIKTDLYMRIVETRGYSPDSTSNSPEKKSVNNEKSIGYKGDERLLQDEKYIRIDYFIRFVLDIVADYKISQIEQLHTMLKICKSNSIQENSLNFEEFAGTVIKFMPNKSMNWIEHAFYDLMNTPSADKLSINNLVVNLMPRMFSFKVPKDYYIRVKPENYPNQDLHNIKSCQFINQNNTNKFNSPKKVNTLGSALFKQNLTISFKQKGIFNQIKYGLNISNPDLMHVAYQVYDTVSSYMILIETYNMLKPRISKIAKQNETLETLNDELLEDLTKLPDERLRAHKYDILDIYSPQELINYLEGCWKKLRYVISICFRPSQNDKLYQFMSVYRFMNTYSYYINVDLIKRSFCIFQYKFEM